MNPVRGTFEIKAGGESFPLRATWDVLANIQDDLGGISIDAIPGALLESITKGSVRIVPKILFRLMQGGGFEGSYADASRIAWDEPMQIPSAISETFKRSGFWGDTKAGEEVADAPASPRKPTSGKRS